MEFEWDESKRLANIGKHGFDFVDVWQLFEGDHIEGSARLGTIYGRGVHHPSHLVAESTPQ